MKHLDLDKTNINLTVIIDEIAANQSEVIITRQGLPVARIVPYTVSDIKYPDCTFTACAFTYGSKSSN